MGVVRFGEASMWTCEEDNEMYALLEVICEHHSSGVWIVTHHFLEEHLELVGEHLLSQGGGGLRQFAPMCSSCVVRQDASNHQDQVEPGLSYLCGSE